MSQYKMSQRPNVLVQNVPDDKCPGTKCPRGQKSLGTKCPKVHIFWTMEVLNTFSTFAAMRLWNMAKQGRWCMVVALILK